MIIDIPSAGIYWRDLGGTQLNTLPVNQFGTVNFTLPQDVQDTLNGNYSDLRFVVLLNGPSMSSPVLVDNLRLEGTGEDTATDTGPDLNEETFEFTLPLAMDLEKVALYASSSLEMADVTSSQEESLFVVNMGAGQTELGVEATVHGSLYSVGNVFLRDRSTIKGDVKTSATIEQQSNVTVEGEITENVDLSLVDEYDWSISWPLAEGNYNLEPDTTLTLSPGSYGNVHIKSRAVLNLSAGTYYMNSFLTEPQAVINITAEDEPVIIYVKEALTSRAQINHSNSPGNFLIAYAGSTVADLDGPFAGTVVAPNATIRLAPLNGGTHEGSFFAKRIEAHARTPINFVKFEFWEHLLPPQIVLECVSRAANFNSAALYSFNNPLGREVHIPAGPNNFAEADILRGDPLQVFASGEHNNLFWLPYIGKEICWTIFNKSVCANLSTRGCTLDDYVLEKSTDLDAGILRNSGDASSDVLLIENDSVSDFKWIDGDDEEYDYATAANMDDSETVHIFTPEDSNGETLYDYDGYSDKWRVEVVSWFRGRPSFWNKLEMRVRLGDYLATTIVCDRRLDYRNGNCLRKNLIFEFPIEERPEDGTELLIRIMDLDVVTGDDKMYAKDLEIPSSAEYQTVCRKGGRNRKWNACFRIWPAGVQRQTFDFERICFDWDVQLTGGAGEHYYNSQGRQRIPAGFLQGKIGIQGGEDEYPEPPEYFVLDKNGCIPSQYGIKRSHIQSTNGDGVSVNFEALGNFLYIESNEVKTKWQIENYDSRQVFSFELKYDESDLLTNEYGEIRLRIPYNNEFTKTGAVVSHIFERHKSGMDMGLIGKNITIWPDSGQAIKIGTAHYDPNPHYYKGIHLRPGQNYNPSGIAQGDATRKFTVAHEIGHALQNLGTPQWDSISRITDSAGNEFTNVLYMLKTIDSQGDIKMMYNPPASPDECRCYATHDYKDYHCMQGLLLTNGALLEGFAHYYSGLPWNLDSECWMTYVKWMYAPNCSPGNTCHDASSLSQEIKDSLSRYPEYPLPNWQMIEAPVRYACDLGLNQSEWHKWRNRHCLGADIIPEGAPIPPLAPGEEEVYRISGDLKALTTEMDWMKFLRELNVSGTPEQKFAINEIFGIIDQASVNSEGHVTYSEMLDVVENNYGFIKIAYFEDAGRLAGVSEDLSHD